MSKCLTWREKKTVHFLDNNYPQYRCFPCTRTTCNRVTWRDGLLHCRVTLVVDYDTYWVDERSEVIYDQRLQPATSPPVSTVRICLQCPLYLFVSVGHLANIADTRSVCIRYIQTQNQLVISAAFQFRWCDYQQSVFANSQLWCITYYCIIQNVVFLTVSLISTFGAKLSF